MSSISMAVGKNKPHALCIPLPFQSHVKAMLKLAKLLHHKGFHITFVNTEFNHSRFLKSLGPDTLGGLPDFRFETVSDGLPNPDGDSNQHNSLLCEAVRTNFLAPFRDLVTKLNDKATSDDINPPLSCIVSDGFMSFAITVAEERRLPIALFFTIAACSFKGGKIYSALVENGLAPVEDESCLTNDFLDKVIDWIPGLNPIRLRDLPSSFLTKNSSDTILDFTIEGMERAHKASAVVFHTFDALERDSLDVLSAMLPRVYAIGPLELLLNNQLPEDPLKQHMGSYSLWKEDTEWLEWLNSKPPNSVVYVNFGSIAVMTPQHLVEFGWGLANSNVPFLWIIRDDLVDGGTAVLPLDFVAETKGRGLISSWCSQEQVLNHRSVGGFLTHSGWNSTVESLSAGVPMICWPRFGDQQTNCYCACHEWGVGMEIDSNVKRDEVEKLVRELMEGEKGKMRKNKAMEWKKLAEEATGPQGSASANFDDLVNQVLLLNE